MWSLWEESHGQFSVMHKMCINRVYSRCAKIKRTTARLAMHFICSKCKGIMEGTVDSIEKLCDEVEMVQWLERPHCSR